MTDTLTLIDIDQEQGTATISLKLANGSTLTGTVAASAVAQAADRIARNEKLTHVLVGCDAAAVAVAAAEVGSLFVYNRAALVDYVASAARMQLRTIAKLDRRWWNRHDASTTDIERAECRHMIRTVNKVLAARMIDQGADRD